MQLAQDINHWQICEHHNETDDTINSGNFVLLDLTLSLSERIALHGVQVNVDA